jgi:uncharacterized protein YjbI with pentapeptide repeats
MYRAQLQGAKLDGADLRRATLDRAQLGGVSFRCVHLQGTLIHYTQLQGASLKRAQLGGASLDGARLQGASLDHAQLGYAFLDYAQLEAAHSPEARFQGASLFYPFGNESYASKAPKDAYLIPIPSSTPLLEEKERILQVTGDQPKVLSRDDYEKELAGWLKTAGCAPVGAPFVLHGLLSNLVSRFRQGSPQLADLATTFLDEKQCRGAHGLSDRDRFELQDIQMGLRPSPQNCTVAQRD